MLTGFASADSFQERSGSNDHPQRAFLRTESLGHTNDPVHSVLATPVL